MKPPVILLIALLLAVSPLKAAVEKLAIGQFEATLQDDNVWLPDSIRWLKQDLEIFKPRLGFNCAFISFEWRGKRYHDENHLIWGDRSKSMPLYFLTDARVVGKKPCSTGEYAGVEVDLESSYARYQRRLLFHQTEPRFKMEYALEFTRDVIIHETDNLGIGLNFQEGFDQVTVYDGRSPVPALMNAAGFKGPSFSMNLLHAGPRLLTHTGKKTSLLVLDSHTGAGLENPPVALLFLPKGRKLTFSIEMILGPQDDAALMQQMADAFKAMPASHRPFLLMENAALLAHQGKIKETEEALLQSAALNTGYARPYGILAGLRRDHKLPGQGDAWREAGYRMPYNNGYILSGSGLWNDKDISEEQRRLHMFNVLIAIENNVYGPDYYLWLARAFSDMNMPIQSLAMHRQALWAVDSMLRGEDVKAKIRQDIRAKIAGLEALVKVQVCTNLPPLIPVRVPEK